MTLSSTSSIQWHKLNFDQACGSVSYLAFLTKKLGQPRPLLPFIFGLFKQTSLQFLQQICAKTSFQHMVPGFEPTTFRTWVNVQQRLYQWRDSNCGPLVSEATTLPTEPQLLSENDYCLCIKASVLPKLYSWRLPFDYYYKLLTLLKV